jgi:hypothetical protein
LALAITLVLASGAQAAYYVFSSSSSCDVQGGTFGAYAAITGGCNVLSAGPWEVGFSDPAVTGVGKYDDSICASDGLLMVTDDSCNELYRAAHICMESTASSGFTMLLSCFEDIVPGTWGNPDNIK